VQDDRSIRGLWGCDLSLRREQLQGDVVGGVELQDETSADVLQAIVTDATLIQKCRGIFELARESTAKLT
jgi:hypothetical protein